MTVHESVRQLQAELARIEKIPYTGQQAVELIKQIDQLLEEAGLPNGGGVINCLTCGTGRDWWRGSTGQWTCPMCEGDPLIADSGHDKSWIRAKFIQQFGPRLPSDAELLSAFRSGKPLPPLTPQQQGAA